MCRKNGKKLLIMGLSAGLLLTVPVSSVNAQAATAKSVQYIAHRGDIWQAPENTMASFKAARKAGYNGVEFDVWVTNSGEFLVNHGSTLKSVYGVNKSVVSLAKGTRKQYHPVAGNNYQEYRDEYIPSARQVIRYLSQHNMYGYLHLKNSAVSMKNLRRLNKIIKTYNMQNKITVFSGQAKVRPILPQVFRRSGSLYCFKKKSDVKSRIRYMRKIGSDVAIFSYNKYVKKSDITYARQRGMKTAFYSAKKEVPNKKLYKYGVDTEIINTKNLQNLKKQ